MDALLRRTRTGPVLLAAAAGLLALAASPAAPRDPAAAPDPSEVRFSVGERALSDWLLAATPYVVTVGRPPLRTELVFSDPSALTLLDGRASFRVRVRGRTLPVDQVLSPVITVEYDARQNRYYGVVASLPLVIPGLATIDLKDSLPRFEIPAVLENIWSFADRPVGMHLAIRRILIRDHALEVAASLRFGPIGQAAAGAPSAPGR